MSKHSFHAEVGVTIKTNPAAYDNPFDCSPLVPSAPITVCVSDGIEINFNTQTNLSAPHSHPRQCTDEPETKAVSLPDVQVPIQSQLEPPAIITPKTCVLVPQSSLRVQPTQLITDDVRAWVNAGVVDGAGFTCFRCGGFSEDTTVTHDKPLTPNCCYARVDPSNIEGRTLNCTPESSAATSSRAASCFDPAKFLDDGFTVPPPETAGGAGIMIFVDVREYSRFKVYLDELNKSGRVSEEVLALFCVKPTRDDVKGLCASVQADPLYKNLEMIHKLKANNLLRDLTAKWRIDHEFAAKYLLVVALETVNDQFRRQYPFPNLTLHAGKIEKGESVFFAATRELFEETRIRVGCVRERIGLMSQGMVMYSAYVTPDTALHIKDDVLYIN